MPRAKMESCSRAPPENRLNSPKTVPPAPAKNCRITSGLIPGVAMWAPTR